MEVVLFMVICVPIFGFLIWAFVSIRMHDRAERRVIEDFLETNKDNPAATLAALKVLKDRIDGRAPATKFGNDLHRSLD